MNNLFYTFFYALLISILLLLGLDLFLTGVCGVKGVLTVSNSEGYGLNLFQMHYKNVDYFFNTNF